MDWDPIYIYQDTEDLIVSLFVDASDFFDKYADESKITKELKQGWWETITIDVQVK
jgi:hypothetical protein